MSEQTSTTLKVALSDWRDTDVAELELAVALGLMPLETKISSSAKHVFWTANPVGEALHHCLFELAKAGVLELDEHEERFRWNPSFVGSWER